jgi:hypothetical protein
MAIASIAVIAWRIPPGTGTLGTDLVVASVPTGEVQVESPGPFITSPGMHPGPESNAPSGTMTIRNIAAAPLTIRVTATVNIGDLDPLLWVALDADGRPLFRGPIGKLEHGSARTFVLPSGADATIGVHVWLPPTVTTGYEGRIANVDLTFEPTTGGAP